MKILNKLIVVFCIVLLTSCATYKLQIDKKSITPFSKQGKVLSHSFFLTGDAGYYDPQHPNKVLSSIQNHLKSVQKNTTLIFLGDNIYPSGMPDKTHPDRKNAENALKAQMMLADAFEGNTIFIPGNHDWYSDRLVGLERQQKLVQNKLGKKSFYPKNGCPIHKKNINDKIVLITIDSEWFMQNWNKSPTMNASCDIKTRNDFFDEFQGIVKKFKDKTIIVASHHPMFSNGQHGGQYSFKQHIFPFEGNKIPLPGIGSLVNLVRKTGGVSPQDLQNNNYHDFRSRLVTMSQESDKVIFVSGHEHNLQFIKQDNISQIISGSGSKATPTKNTEKGVFSYGNYGFARLNVYNDGSSEVKYYAMQDDGEKMVFTTQVLPPDKKRVLKKYSIGNKSTKKASIYTEKETTKRKFYRFFWGERYRKEYSTLIEAPVLNLDDLFGGVTPVRKGGGFQTKSLRLRTKDGKEYVMRALRKSSLKLLQAAFFKEKYIGGHFENTVIERELADIFTGAHPYTPLVVSDLSEAVGVYHTSPKLYYVPKQNALKEFNEEFGDELYLIEEHAGDGHGDKAGFGYSNKLINTNDFLKALRKSEKHKLDENAYIRARLFDMLIGDWDRHADQWRWATFKQDDGTTLYRPVPRDRDQAFSKMADGVLMGTLTKLLPDMRKMQSYNEELKNPKWFNRSPYPLDVAFVRHSNKNAWDKQVAYLQKNLTDEVIEKAFKKIPKNVNNETISEIKRMLKGRRDNLKDISDRYIKYLNKYVVVKGTDKKDYFTVEPLTDKQTRIRVSRLNKDGSKGTTWHDKVYSRNDSKEIWIYGLDDKDIFEVKGRQPIKLRIIGGQNNDTYKVEKGTHVHIYDHKSIDNNIEAATKARIHRSDKYNINTYDYRKFDYTRNQILPNIGYNPEDGLQIGITDIFTYYGFDRNPFTQQHTLKANYYSAHSGAKLQYKGEFADIIGSTNLLLEGFYTNSTYADNFFGVGNETDYDDNLDFDYYRVRKSTYGGALGLLLFKSFQGSKLYVKGIFESIKLDDAENRILTSARRDLNINTVDLFERKEFAGVEANFSYESYNDDILPTLGMLFAVDAGYKVNVDNTDRSILYMKPTAGFIHNLSRNHRWVFYTKIGSHINFLEQDDLEIYQMARIGGENGLRGFNSERFSGKNSLYADSNISFSLKEIKTRFIPLDIGLFAGFDIGRVWAYNENSSRWHNSEGGGIFIEAADMVSGAIGVFNSTDGIRIAFKFGLKFDH